jgi:glucokinase
MDTYLALDLGGTKLMIAEVTEKGEILRQKQYPSGYLSMEEGAEKICGSLDDYMETVGLAGRPAALGMGLTGKVDYKRGIWRSLGHLDAPHMVPIAQILQEKTGLEATVDNDMHSAATAELLLGCGTYADDFVYLNVGTGLAVGLVSGRHVIHGANNMSGEIGHTSIGPYDFIQCGCGKKGCCEHLISGIGFNAQARRLLAEYPETKLHIPEAPKKVSGLEVFRLAEEGDPMCVRIVDQGIEALVILITNIVRYTDPSVIVMGGGMSMNDALFERVKEGISQYTVMGNVEHGLVRSAFSPDKVGIIGAAALAMAKHRGLA